MKPNTGVAICHYDRTYQLREMIQAVKETVSKRVKVVVCDDGSMYNKDTEEGVSDICRDEEVVLIAGPNLGVAYNKNRALWALQDMDFICILEDDLKPIKEDWITHYEQASILSGIHHFCRVQDRELISQNKEFDAYMIENGLTPIYGPSPRGDLTFITRKVIKTVGGFNKNFVGAGYAHGEWSSRIHRAGLIEHPNIWIDIKEGRDSFEQIGDREGGRWNNKKKTRADIKRNKALRAFLDEQPYTYDKLELL